MRIANRIRTKCQKGRNPMSSENSPNINYNGDIEDNHDEGTWAGFAHVAKLGSPTPKKPMYVRINAASGVTFTEMPNNEKEK
jgi:hypothetical protein